MADLETRIVLLIIALLGFAFIASVLMYLVWFSEDDHDRKR